MEGKKKSIKGSSPGNLRSDGTDKRYEYPEIDLDKAGVQLEHMEKTNSKFKKFMDSIRKGAGVVIKGAKLVLFFLFVMFSSRWRV